MPAITVLAAGSSHTSTSAGLVLEEFGFDAAELHVMQRFGFLIIAGSEWRLDTGLRNSAIGYATDRAEGLWRQAHEYYFGVASLGDPARQPAYISSGPGLAYHGAELNADWGMEGYKAVAHIDSLAVNLEALKLAQEQSKRGLLAERDPVLIFLRGMTYYRMGRQADGVRLLRQVAALEEQTAEVAVAQHLVGHWDCLRSHRGDPEAAKKMMRSSHKNAVKRNDTQHLAHVKHSMALCILRTSPRDVARAIKLLRQSLLLTQQTGDEWGEAKVLHTIGQALSKSAEGHAEARRCLEKSRDIGLRLGYSRHVASVSDSLAGLPAPREKRDGPIGKPKKTTSKGRSSFARSTQGQASRGKPALKRVSGVVKSFDRGSGFGFIEINEDGPDVFFRRDDIQPSSTSLVAGDQVEFQLIVSAKGWSARHIRLRRSLQGKSPRRLLGNLSRKRQRKRPDRL